MRGKKTDPVFISEFIRECVSKLGLLSSDEIIKHAKILIQNIDEEIKAIEKKKIMRSKLLDVIASFEKQSKDKTEDAKLLPFFKLENSNICKVLCDVVKIKPILVGDEKLDPDARFAIKQLLECKVLARESATDQIIRGERFDEYMTFVLREGQ